MLLLRIGQSKKGWITGEISAEWIKQFDELTCKKVPGQPRLLLVDGHCSHYTYEFLNYACAHDIHVLCYPSHATHMFQGLDVICFALLKCFFEEECRKFESQGHGVVKKEHFLSVYSKSNLHLRRQVLFHTTLMPLTLLNLSAALRPQMLDLGFHCYRILNLQHQSALSRRCSGMHPDPDLQLVAVHLHHLVAAHILQVVALHLGQPRAAQLCRLRVQLLMLWMLRPLVSAQIQMLTS